MLDGNRVKPDLERQKNMVMLYYMPLDTVPSVVSFRANANAKPPRVELLPGSADPALTPSPNPDVASFRR